MASDLWNIFLNVVAAFIYAGIVWLWQNRGNKTSLPSRPILPPEPSNGGPADRRVRNRRSFKAAAEKFFIYLFTFAPLYLSITLPLLFKALITKDPILLSQARHVGEFLPSIPVSNYYLQITLFVIAAAIYWPLLLLSEAITSLLYPLVDAFWPVTERVWYAIMMFIFLVFCIPVAATSVWLFYEKSYGDSLVTVLVFMFFFFAASYYTDRR